MPERVGHFRGRPVHGTNGEYVFRHVRDNIEVHVHRLPGSSSWAVSVDRDSTGSPGTVESGMTRNEALDHAYRRMRAMSGDAHPDDGRGPPGHKSDWDFGGGA